MPGNDDKTQILLAAESGIVTLFSNQLTGRLSGWGAGNVFLVCMAAKVIKDAIPASQARLALHGCVFGHVCV